VAFSGGVDSLALLHAVRELVAHQPALSLRAIHVDHGLQDAARDWADYCREHCQRLAVPIEVVELKLEVAKGESVEAEARRERYAALAARLLPGECLLTAHHADDQLETVLLQLFRGAGVAGLAAMPDAALLGPGLHLRPLLQTPREDLVAYATVLGLEWIEDPMNCEDRYDRAYLRQQVLPALRARWPSVAQTVGRSARHLGEAQRLIDDLAVLDARAVEEGECLRVEPLLALAPARQANLIRWWLRRRGLVPPNTARLQSILANVLPAKPGARPVVQWNDGQVWRACGRLHASVRRI